MYHRVFLFCVLLTAAASASAQETLQPFTSIVVRGGVDAGIRPNSDGSYSYQMIDGRVSAVVEDGVLYIDNSRPFGGYGVTIVSVPATAVSSLITEGGGDVIMSNGFQVESFSVTATGNGDTTVSMDISGPLTVEKSGRGTVIVSGSSESLTLQQSGNGDSVISGVQGDASVDIEGRGDVVIAGGPDLEISGKGGRGQILYTNGSCSIPQCVKTSATLDLVGGKRRI